MLVACAVDSLLYVRHQHTRNGCHHSVALVFGVFYERRDKLCALFKLLASAIEVVYIRQLRSLLKSSHGLDACALQGHVQICFHIHRHHMSTVHHQVNMRRLHTSAGHVEVAYFQRANFEIATFQLARVERSRQEKVDENVFAFLGEEIAAAHLTSVSYVGCFKGRVQPVDDDAGALLCRKFDNHVLRRHREKTTESVAKSSCDLVLLFNIVIRALTSRGNVEQEFFVVIGAEAEREDFNLWVCVEHLLCSGNDGLVAQPNVSHAVSEEKDGAHRVLLYGS
mmetsp:Transcript_84543/g.137037  ORF Transcript_84543/g.137037 Transcript_84543/m.137037 type:complete len:281 (+) Transcript_84543:606-1448(+)